MNLSLDEKGHFVDLYSENTQRPDRTFISSADLAKYIHNSKGPHVIVGGLPLSAKREAAAIVKNVHVGILKYGTPYGRKDWERVAQTAVEVG